jgi:chromosome segregation ATPase
MEIESDRIIDTLEETIKALFKNITVTSNEKRKLQKAIEYLRNDYLGGDEQETQRQINEATLSLNEVTEELQSWKNKLQAATDGIHEGNGTHALIYCKYIM